MSSQIVVFFMTLFVGCGLVSADTIKAYDMDWGRAEQVNMLQDGHLVLGAYTGVIKILLTGDGPNAQTVARDTLCVDAFVDISLGYTYGTVVTTPPLVPPVPPKQNLGTVAWLVDNALVPGERSFTSSLPKEDWVISSAQGAGIQLAIWDIVEDNGDGFSAGRIEASTVKDSTTDAAVLLWAEKYECLAMGLESPSCQPAGIKTPPGGVRTSNLAFVYLNTVLPGDPGNPGDRAQMLEGPQFEDPGPQPTPEPSSLGLGGIGLVAVSLVLRKKLG